MIQSPLQLKQTIKSQYSKQTLIKQDNNIPLLIV